MRGLLVVFISTIVCLSNTFSQLPNDIKKIFEASAFEYATASLCVKELSGKTVYSFQSDKKLIPASSLKLITNLYALSKFGSQYTFNTKVGYTGALSSDGTLTGDVIIIGSGDPTFASLRFGPENDLEEVLQRISNAVKEKITCIDGNVVILDYVFDGSPVVGSWPYGDISNYYASGAWAINFNENAYKLTFNTSGNIGSIASVYAMDPQIPYLEVFSEVKLDGANTGDNAYVFGSPYQYRKIVRGSVPKSGSSFTIKGAVPNPPLSFAMLLKQELEDDGIKVQGVDVSSEKIKKSDFNELLNIESHDLLEIIQQANYESINLYCESLIRLSAKMVTGTGSYDSGIEMLSNVLKSTGCNENSFSIQDGSGLSPRNLITTESFTTFLAKYFSIIGEETIKEIIPQASVSGTVKVLLKDKSFAKNFYLKSGSMGGVLSYSGYVKSNSGKWYAISFISNNHSKGNYKVKREAEKIFTKLYNIL